MRPGYFVKVGRQVIRTMVKKPQVVLITIARISTEDRDNSSKVPGLIP